MRQASAKVWQVWLAKGIKLCKRQIWEDKPLTCMHEFLAFCIISGLIVISSCPKECQFGNGVSHLGRQIESIMKVRLDRLLLVRVLMQLLINRIFKATNARPNL